MEISRTEMYESLRDLFSGVSIGEIKKYRIWENYADISCIISKIIKDYAAFSNQYSGFADWWFQTHVKRKRGGYKIQWRTIYAGMPFKARNNNFKGETPEELFKELQNKIYARNSVDGHKTDYLCGAPILRKDVALLIHIAGTIKDSLSGGFWSRFGTNMEKGVFVSLCMAAGVSKDNFSISVPEGINKPDRDIDGFLRDKHGDWRFVEIKHVGPGNSENNDAGMGPRGTELLLSAFLTASNKIQLKKNNIKFVVIGATNFIKDFHSKITEMGIECDKKFLADKDYIELCIYDALDYLEITE